MTRNAMEWAADAARRIAEKFDSDGSAFETANYQLCDFILGAARLALADKDVARRIGEQMEPERE